MVSLASGYGNFAVPATAMEAALAVLADVQSQAKPLEVSAVAGTPELREALAQRYRERGAASVSAAQVLVTSGAKTGLFAILSELLAPGDEVLMPTPNWFGFWELVRRAGGTLRTLPLAAADGYALTPEALRAALTPQTKLLIISNPNNPTGRVYTRAEWEAVLAVTAEFPQLWVLGDEIYEGINFGPEPVPTLLSFPDPHQRHVVVSGFSKSLALAGWGVGCAVVPATLAPAVGARLFGTGLAVPVLAQAAALAATLQADAIGGALCAQLAPNRRLLLDGLAALSGAATGPVPGGTYYIFADFTRFLDPQLPAAEASAQLVQQLAAAGLVVVDGATCGAPGFARLSYAVPPADLARAVAILQEVLAPVATR